MSSIGGGERGVAKARSEGAGLGLVGAIGVLFKQPILI